MLKKLLSLSKQIKHNEILTIHLTNNCHNSLHSKDSGATLIVMKKVIFEQSQLLTIKDFQEMLRYALDNNKSIGFTPKDYSDDKYLLITAGDARGLAVNHTGTWTSETNQETELGDYFIFDNPSELYKWMSE